MSDITKIKQLREETNVSYIMCQKALEEAKGDLDKARDILKKKGAEVAEKKRTAKPRKVLFSPMSTTIKKLVQ